MEIQIARAVNMHKEEFDVRVDRKTEWGNPYKVNKSEKHSSERNRVCDLHAEGFWCDPVRHTRLHTLIGQRLGCHCSPKRCHADFLANEANLLYLSSQKAIGAIMSHEWPKLYQKVKIYSINVLTGHPMVTPGIVTHYAGIIDPCVTVTSLFSEDVTTSIYMSRVTEWLPL